MKVDRQPGGSQMGGPLVTFYVISRISCLVLGFNKFFAFRFRENCFMHTLSVSAISQNLTFVIIHTDSCKAWNFFTAAVFVNVTKRWRAPSRGQLCIRWSRNSQRDWALFCNEHLLTIDTLFLLEVTCVLHWVSVLLTLFCHGGFLFCRSRGYRSMIKSTASTIPKKCSTLKLERKLRTSSAIKPSFLLALVFNSLLSTSAK